jgi:16S rRNA (uracil1498-N3)-methyltransferase
MIRFYLPPAECKGPVLWLTDREAHHASHVMRVRPGERINVLDGEGREFDCEVDKVEKTKVRLRIIEERRIPRLPWRVTLLQAVPKGKLFDSIIQKATELGVYRIVPLLSERVVAQLDDDHAMQKVAKWQLTAIESIKQCGSAWLPRIETPLTPAEFLARKEQFDLPLIGSLQSNSQHPREHFRAFYERNQARPNSLAIWIGPEGDFTSDEYAAIEGAGALPITLGRLVLRTETAAIYCLSIFNYELQSKGP